MVELPTVVVNIRLERQRGSPVFTNAQMPIAACSASATSAVRVTRERPIESDVN